MPSNYCVTFRIANKAVNGVTYDERRQRLIANVTTAGMGYWEETTSFFLVESALDTHSFAKAAVRGLSSKDDMVFVFDPEDKSGCYFGPVDRPDVLTSFFPKAIKIG